MIISILDKCKKPRYSIIDLGVIAIVSPFIIMLLDRLLRF